MRVQTLALLVPVLIGCSGASNTDAINSSPLPIAEPEELNPSAETEESQEQSRVTDMHLHFDDVNAIQLALISGNLVRTRELAKKVRIGFSGEAPHGWAPFIERSVASAEMLEVTTDLGMAARLAGTMAGTCGDCHRAQNVMVVDHVAVAPPRDEDRFSDFMIQHRWAADRMWEGLIGPSDAAWLAGAEALQATELTASDVGERLVLTPEIETLLAQIRKDANAAATTHGAAARQELYGSFLAGCASCHRDMMNQRD